MTSFIPNIRNFLNVKDKVVVLTGGANGIGAATVKLFASEGACIIFGDIDPTRGVSIAAATGKDAHFVPTDVTSYDSLLALFDKAFALYGHVDIAVSNAGIIERPGWFDYSHDLESIRKAPSTAVLDVNLIGTLYFAHIAAVYLRQNSSPTDDKSLILLSSVAGFQESPGLFVYQATKHGIVGLMRSLRKYFPGAYGNSRIRVNCICPWATDTAMISTFRAAWQQEGLPLNSAEDVARIILGVSVDKELNGESIYVEGGRGWAIEEGLDRTQPQWLGKSAAFSLAKGQAFLGAGSKWST